MGNESSGIAMQDLLCHITSKVVFVYVGFPHEIGRVKPHCAIDIKLLFCLLKLGMHLQNLLERSLSVLFRRVEWSHVQPTNQTDQQRGLKKLPPLVVRLVFRIVPEDVAEASSVLANLNQESYSSDSCFQNASSTYELT